MAKVILQKDNRTGEVVIKSRDFWRMTGYHSTPEKEVAAYQRHYDVAYGTGKLTFWIGDETEASVHTPPFQKQKNPCVKYESSQEPEKETSVCFSCGWLRKDHHLLEATNGTSTSSP